MELKKIFNPSSIAIVGVSEHPRKVGHLVAKNIIDQGYKGELFFVNNKYQGKIFDKKVFSSLSSVGRPIDLAVLAIPAEAALPIIDEVNQLDIKNAILFAAGFKEIGEAGEQLEKLLGEKIRTYGMNLLGPNCLGFVNTALGINATFLKNSCPQGNISFISQSGALGSALNDYFLGHKNLGFSYFISLGNKTKIDESDALEFLASDKNTSVIALYLEDIKNGEKFKKAVVKAGQKKPIIVLKSGTTKEGSKAAVSHTGGMIGDDQVYNAVFKQTGIIRAENFYGLISLLKIFSYGRQPINKNILILSNAGGAGVLLTDELIKNNLSMMTVSPAIQKKLEKESQSRKITVHNPIDLLGDASAFDYKAVIEATLKEKNIGAVIILLTPQANTQIEATAKVIVELQKGFNQPFYPIFMGKKSMSGVGKLFENFEVAGFANFDYLPEALAKIVWWQNNLKKNNLSSVLMKLDNLKSPSFIHDFVRTKEIKKILSSSNNKTIDLIDSLKIIKLCNIPVESLCLVGDKKKLNETAKITGFPLVAKIISDKFTHKTEVGGVVANIKSIDELNNIINKFYCINTIKQKKFEIALQHQVNGVEILVGAKRDTVFGPVIAVGLGGIYTELLKEVVNFIYPFSFEEFTEAVQATKLEKLLTGFRSLPPIDKKKLYQIAIRIGKLMDSFPEIKEIDINPLIADAKKLTVVDCRIVL